MVGETCRVAGAGINRGRCTDGRLPSTRHDVSNPQTENRTSSILILCWTDSDDRCHSADKETP